MLEREIDGLREQLQSGEADPAREPKGRRPEFEGEARVHEGSAMTNADDAIGGSNSDAARKAEWDLKLYVAGQTPRSVAALANLRRICDEHLAGRYRVQIIDLLLNPQLAQEDQIVAIPTLVRSLPPPLRKIIGDLSSTERVLVGLQVRRADS